MDIPTPPNLSIRPFCDRGRAMTSRKVVQKLYILFSESIGGPAILTSNKTICFGQGESICLLCHSRRKWDFIPELNIKGEDRIEILDEFKVVSFILRNGMKTYSNTFYIMGKAYKQMWLFRRLKALGATNAELIDTLEKQKLSLLWLGAPSCYCLLTQTEKTNIERVGKVGMKIIFGEHYSGLETSTQFIGISRNTLQVA